MTYNPVLEEYKICSETASHLDEQNWMWGSFLFGGSIAGAGFVLSQPTLHAFSLLVLSLLSTVILVGYIFYVKRSIGIKDACFSRMRAIEATQFPNLVFIERQLNYLNQYRVMTGFESVKPIRLARVRSFDVLTGMVICYLTILYAGTIALTIAKGFLFP